SASSRGYGHLQAPAGIQVATGYGGGGSHGGVGYGSAGATYDSVYVPQQAGAGGSPGRWNGSPGGGIVRISAGSLVLDGEVHARGGAWCGGGGGGGGSIRFDVGTLSGSGLASAGGGDESKGSCAYSSEGGGGGRIALTADLLDGFDPATQLQAWGGEDEHLNNFGGAGTAFYRLPEHDYGVLVVDNGELADGTDRATTADTVLPELTGGAVTALDAEGADAWLTGTAAHLPRWLGTWVVLLDGAGGELGAFEVAGIDAAGRLRLVGAAAASSAVDYRGEYRFDRVELHNGSNLESPSRLLAGELSIEGGGSLGGDVETGGLIFEDGTIELTAPLVTGSLTVKSGASLVPQGSLPLEIEVAGSFVIEAGAYVSATGRGYTSQQAPAGIQGATGYGGGGSHGGVGYASAGATYDSVYVPHQAGAGGSPGRWSGSPGGGIVRISAASLVLDGEVHARGSAWCGGGGGGGGSIRLDVGTLSGSGLARAEGGDEGVCYYSAEPGGGGRIAVVADLLDGFDPATQLRAWGGADGGENHFAGAGTAFFRLPEHDYGVLVVDNGTLADGTARATSNDTVLPELAGGAVTSLDADGGDAWLTGPAAHQARWLGAWVVLADATGGELGVFEVTEIDASGRLRLAGGAAVASATSYSGEYRFDRVELRNGSNVETASRLVTGDLSLEGGGAVGGDFTVGTMIVDGGTFELAAPLVADSVTLRNSAALVPLGSQPLEIDVSGTLTVETGSTISAYGRGYTSGQAPAGVSVSTSYGAGGSHGGRGRATSGETYDSPFEPSYGGAGGAGGKYGGSPGGGVIHLSAASLVLDGVLDSGGADWCGGGGGGGGTILLEVGSLSGSGTARAHGGNAYTSGCIYNSSSGGGGRIAVHLDAFDAGFDPATQLLTWGGENNGQSQFGGAGTVYYRLPSHTHGALMIDNGRRTDGSDRVSDRTTALPAIGRGVVGLAEADAGTPSDLWIEPEDPSAEFGLGVVGAFVRIGGIDYPVVDQSADLRRLLLGGASGAVAVGDSYVGVWKLDELTLAGSADLEIVDGLEV
ncbi:MAG TPA: hypothetical protein VKU40_11720, partial [Thermoanaerobaculia bacterium]|nr:hypothetical protein [Thermoanaerobaculia bacterium]